MFRRVGLLSVSAPKTHICRLLLGNSTYKDSFVIQCTDFSTHIDLFLRFQNVCSGASFIVAIETSFH